MPCRSAHRCSLVSCPSFSSSFTFLSSTLDNTQFSLLLRFAIMGSVGLPYLQDNPKIIFFTDFDGTITLLDSKSSWVQYLKT